MVRNMLNCIIVIIVKGINKFVLCKTEKVFVINLILYWCQMSRHYVISICDGL